MAYYSPFLTIIFIAFAQISLYVTKIISQKNLEYSAKRQEDLAYLTGIAEEYYTGRDVIRAYNHEDESIKAIEHALTELQATTKKTDFFAKLRKSFDKIFVKSISRGYNAYCLLQNAQRLNECGRCSGVFPIYQFGGTVAQNIACGKTDATFEEI